MPPLCCGGDGSAPNKLMIAGWRGWVSIRVARELGRAGKQNPAYANSTVRVVMEMWFWVQFSCSRRVRGDAVCSGVYGCIADCAVPVPSTRSCLPLQLLGSLQSGKPWHKQGSHRNDRMGAAPESSADPYITHLQLACHKHAFTTREQHLKKNGLAEL